MAQEQQRDDYAKTVNEGGGVKGERDYSSHAGPVAQQQQQRDDYAEAVTDEGGGAAPRARATTARTPARWARSSSATTTPRP